MEIKEKVAGFTPDTEHISLDAAFELAATLKAGSFQFGDAQSSVTHKFANMVIERHERMRASAPELYEALKEIVRFEEENLSRGEFISRASYDEMFARARAALLKAEGGEIG